MEQTKTTYKQELKTRIDSLLERAIVIQGQLTYSINTGDFFLAAGYFDELGGVFKAAAKAMREAGRKRNLETEPLEKIVADYYL